MSEHIYCQHCSKRKQDVPEGMRRCSGCKCVYYCGVACRDADWPKHKKYCKQLLFVKSADLPAFNHDSFKAKPESSELYSLALRAAEASGDAKEKGLVLITPVVAEHFVKACEMDYLPAGPAEERIWGLYGDPSGKDYQRLLLLTCCPASSPGSVKAEHPGPHTPRTQVLLSFDGYMSRPHTPLTLLNRSCYQKALKFGDLSASKLMECLLARPAASQALTKILRKCKLVMTEKDSLDAVMHVADRYAELADGIVVDSEFDKWPLPAGAS